MKPVGIEKQVLLVALIPVLLMTILLSGYFVFSRFDDLDEALIKRSQMLASQIASSSEYAVFSNNKELLQQEVDAVLIQRDVSKVLVLDASLKPIVAKSRDGLGQFETLLLKANAASPFYQDAGVLILYAPITATQIKLNDFDFDKGVKSAQTKLPGAVIIEISKHRLVTKRQQIILLSLLLTLLILAVSILLALWATHRISYPITAMSQELHSFGEGNLDSRKHKELAKTRFLAAAGHDLRQPLAAANLFIDALKFTNPTEKQNVIIARLDQAMSNFNGLLDTLLNVSKLDGGMIKPEYTAVPVAEIFEWIEQSFAPAANKKQIRFILHYPMKEMLAVHADIDLLKSVLMNLISNAIKFTAKGGILVGARHRGGQLLFQVWDTGIGIADEHIKHIFDEFYQVDNPQRDRVQGLGLGLYIVKRSLGLFDGDVCCHSKVGRGTVFEFLVPLTDSLK